MSNFDAKITITAVDKVSQVMKSISRRMDGLRIAASKVSTSFVNVGHAAGNFGRELRTVGLIAAGAGAAVYGIVRSTVNVGDELSKMSQKTGIAAETIQKLRFSAELGGASVTQLDTGLRFLTKSIGDAQKGSNDQAKAFDKLKVKTEIGGKLRDVESIFYDVTDAISKMTNETEKATIMMYLFGARSGQSFVPMMEGGSKAIKEQGEEAKRLMHIWTPYERSMAVDLQDRTTELTKAFGGLKDVIGIGLMPAIKDITVGMTEYIVQNRKLIAENVGSIFAGIGRGLTVVYNAIKSVTFVFAPFIKAIGGLKTVVTGVVIVVLSKLAFSFGKLLWAIGLAGKALGAFYLVLVANPVFQIAAAIGILLGAIYLLIKHWDLVKKKMEELWAFAKPFVEGFLNFITLGMYSVAKKIYQNWDEIALYLDNKFGWIIDAVTTAFNAVYNAVASVLDPMFSYIEETWGAITGFIMGQLDKLLGYFGTSLEGIKSAVSSFIDPISAAFKQLTDFIGGVAYSIAQVKSTLFGDDTDLTQAVKFTSDTSGIDEPQALNIERKVIDTPFSQSQPQAQAAAGSVGASQSAAQTSASTTNKLDVHMEIDYQGVPTKVTAKSATNPINFSASVGRMV